MIFVPPLKSETSSVTKLKSGVMPHTSCCVTLREKFCVHLIVDLALYDCVSLKKSCVCCVIEMRFMICQTYLGTPKDLSIYECEIMNECLDMHSIWIRLA